MLTSNGINYISSSNDAGAVFLYQFRRKAALKNYPITGYYAQLYDTTALGSTLVRMKDLTSLELPIGDTISKANINAVSNLVSLLGGKDSKSNFTSLFPVNTFITSNNHRISFKFKGANKNPYDLLLLYAFDELELYDQDPSLNSIISNLNNGDFATRLRYLCGILKFGKETINFNDVDTIIDLSEIIIPQCSFKCLIESDMNNISHYRSDYLKMENIYDSRVDGNQFIFKETAQHRLTSQISNDDPENGTMTISKSGLIKY